MNHEAYIKEIEMELDVHRADNPECVLLTVDCWVKLTKAELLSVAKQLTEFAEGWDEK